MYVQVKVTLFILFFLISDPMDDYDPCSPTESPDIEIDDDDILLHSGSSSRYVLQRHLFLDKIKTVEGLGTI